MEIHNGLQHSWTLDSQYSFFWQNGSDKNIESCSAFPKFLTTSIEFSNFFSFQSFKPLTFDSDFALITWWEQKISFLGSMAWKTLIQPF